LGLGLAILALALVSFFAWGWQLFVWHWSAFLALLLSKKFGFFLALSPIFLT
jgi:hypothetical protein